MASAAELMVLFRGDASGLNKAADESKGIVGGLVDGLGKIGLAGMGFGVIKDAASAIIGPIGDSIGAAEGLGDAIARSEGVFGPASASIVSAAQAQANALGLTKEAYVAAAAKTGDLVTSMGIGKSQAAEMASSFADLAPKLAAYTGMDVESANAALTKGLTGATKGLKEMGIVVGDIPKGLSDAAQAQFIYDAVLAQSGEAQKAWAGNQGDVETSMARVSAAMTDAKAAIGDVLLPVLAPLAEQFAGLASTLTGAVTPAIDIFKAIVSGSWGEEATAGMRALNDSMGPMGQTLTDLTFLAGSVVNVFQGLAGGDVAGAMEFLGDAVANVMHVLEDLTGLDLGPVYNFLFGSDDGAPGAWDAITTAVTGAYTALTDILAPISEVISLSDVLIPIIGVALVAAFGAWAISAASAAASTIMAMAPVLIPIAAIGLAVALLKAAWENNWGGIQEKTAAVVDWLKANAWPLIEEGIARVKEVIADLQPTVEAVFGRLKEILDSVIGWFSENSASILQIFGGVWSVISGLVSGAMSLVTGIVRAAMALIRGDFDGAGKAMQSAISGAVAGIGRALGGLWGIVVGALKLVLSNAIPAAKAIGHGIIDGITFVLKGGGALIWGAVKGLVGGLIGTVKALLGIASPSKVFEEIGAFIVAGLAGGITDNALKAVEAASKMASGVASAAKSMVDLFTTLSSREAQRSTEGLADRFKLLAAALAPIRQSLADLGAGIGDDEGKALDGASKALSGIAGAVRSVAEAFTSLAPREGSRGNMLALVIPDEGLLRTMQDRMRLMLGIASDLSVAFGAGVGFVGLELITGAVSSMAGALKAVSDLDLAGTAGIAERDMSLAVAAINSVVLAIGPIVQNFIAATGNEDVRAAVSEGAKRWQETVGALAGGLKAVADLKVSEAASLAQGTLTTLKGNIELISATFGGLVAGFIDMDKGAAGTTEAVATGAKRWQETVGAMTTAVKAMLDVSVPLEDVTSLTPSVLAKVTRSYEVIRDGLQEMIAAWAAMEQASPGSQDVVSSSAKTWADTVTSMVKVVADVLKLDVPETIGIDALRNLIGPIRDFAVVALAAVQAAAEAWRGAMTSGELERLSASIKGWTDGVGASVKILADISKLENPDFLAVQSMNDPVLLTRLLDYAKLALGLVSQAAEGFRTLTAETRDKLVGSVKAWTDSAGQAVKLLSEVGGIGDLSGAPSLGIIAGLADWAKGALDAIRSRVVVLQPGDLDQIEVFTAGAGAAVKMLSGMSKDLEGIKDAPAPDPGLISRLSETAKLILTAVKDALAMLTTDELTKIATGGGALEAANKGLASLGDALASIMDNPFMSLSRRRSTFSKDVFKRRLTESIKETVQTLSDAMSSITFNDVALEQLGKFGDAWGKMADSLAKISGTRIDMAAIRAAALAVGVLVSATPGGGAIGGGGAAGGAAVTITVDRIEAKTATINEVGLAVDMRLDGQPLVGGITAAYQRNPSELDKLIRVIDQRRGGGP